MKANSQMPEKAICPTCHKEVVPDWELAVNNDPDCPPGWSVCPECGYGFNPWKQWNLPDLKGLMKFIMETNSFIEHEAFLIARGWTKKSEFCWHKRFPTADFTVGIHTAIEIENQGL